MSAESGRVHKEDKSDSHDRRKFLGRAGGIAAALASGGRGLAKGPSRRVLPESEDSRAARAHYRDHGINFWEELIEQEKETGERYVGAVGNVQWVIPFAPRGRLFDAIAIFRGVSSFLELTQKDIQDFSSGLLNAFKDLKEHGFYSFNLTIHSETSAEEHFWCHARIMARFTFFSTGVSDKSYMELLDSQMFSRITPERMCQSLKKYFQE